MKAILLVALPLLAAGGDSRTEEERLLARLLLLQERVGSLAQAIDMMRIGGLQECVPPGWVLEDPTLYDSQIQLANHFWKVQALDPAFFERVRRQRLGVHWDMVQLYSRMQKSGPYYNCEEWHFYTSRAIDSILEGEEFRDPFHSHLTLGYASTSCDYVLVSRGPDGDSDLFLLALTHLGYEDTFTTSNSLSIAEARSLDIESWYGGNYSPYESTLRIDRTKLYDPTNGALSDGDIVFHRFGGDNLLFSFRSNAPITYKHLVPRSKDELQMLVWGRPAGQP